jgi:hypothetical protein
VTGWWRSALDLAAAKLHLQRCSASKSRTMEVEWRKKI